MRIETKKVYYCEFCKKHGLSSGHMGKHERHCTGNPDRECRFCHDDVTPKDGAERRALAKRLFPMVMKEVNSPEPGTALKWLSDQVENCPGCMLNILRLAELTSGCIEDEHCKPWDFEAACQDRFAEFRQIEAEADYDAMMRE